MESSTKQFRKRNAILSCLRGTDIHPSAEMVHDMLQQEHPDISLATVYRNLSRFKDQGVIQSLGTVHGIERFDANTEPHVHFICHTCGAVAHLERLETPETLNAKAEAAIGCKVGQCQLYFTGQCRTCLNQ
jgi:Fur family peroxide stress response transcriptional regulator